MKKGLRGARVLVAPMRLAHASALYVTLLAFTEYNSSFYLRNRNNFRRITMLRLRNVSKGR
jgi:hypothetical protein